MQGGGVKGSLMAESAPFMQCIAPLPRYWVCSLAEWMLGWFFLHKKIMHNRFSMYKERERERVWERERKREREREKQYDDDVDNE